MEKITIGNCELYHADAFEVLPSLDDGTIDMVASDPPYGITSHHWDEAPPFETMWNLFDAKTKPSANFVLFGAGKFSIDLVNSKYEWYRYDLSWVKNNKTGFLNASLMPLRNHENVLIFGRPGHQKSATYNPLHGTIHPCSALPFDHERGSNQAEKCFHPTMKPIKLMGYLTMLYSNPNDLVLDCFMGSGTTGLAALKLGRRFIGIERERSYFEIAVRRLEEVQRRKTSRYKPRVDSPSNPNESVAVEQPLVPVITEGQPDLIQDRGAV